MHAVPRELDWEQIARTHAHPLRFRILERLARDDATMSPVELSREFDVPVNLMAYHVKQLHEKGLLTLSSTRARRGATEHFYCLAR
jgi:predicted transcriptional regulator